MKVRDESLIINVIEKAKNSPKLRMNRRQTERRYKLVYSLPKGEGGKAELNYNFHQSLEDKCHRFLNAVEPGTVVPIDR